MTEWGGRMKKIEFQDFMTYVGYEILATEYQRMATASVRFRLHGGSDLQMQCRLDELKNYIPKRSVRKVKVTVIVEEIE